MKIEVKDIELGFITYYENHQFVDKTIVKWKYPFSDSLDSYADVHMKTGDVFRILHLDGKEEIGPYQGQHGLAVSPDGTKIFIQSWERGLYAYDIKTGNRLWRAKLTQVRKVVALPDCVVCSIDGKGLRRLNYDTGAILETYKCGEAELFPIQDDLAFIGSYQQKWMLIHLTDFSIIETIPDRLFARRLNSIHGLTYLRKVELQNDKLILTRWETMVDDPSAIVLVVELSNSF